MPTVPSDWKIGPVVRRLVIYRASQTMASEGLVKTLENLSDPGMLRQHMRDAGAWAWAAINAVRLASHPNPWARSSDEEIAQEILSRADQQRGRRDGRTDRP